VCDCEFKREVKENIVGVESEKMPNKGLSISFTKRKNNRHEKD